LQEVQHCLSPEEGTVVSCMTSPSKQFRKHSNIYSKDENGLI